MISTRIRQSCTRTFLVLLIGLFLCSILLAAPVAAKTLTVATDGSGDYTSIASAASAAAAGDTVYIKAGSYSESQKEGTGVSILVSSNDVIIRGESPDKVFVNPQAGTVTITGSGCHLENLTLINSASITISGNSCEIKNNVLIAKGSISIRSSNNIVANNVIINPFNSLQLYGTLGKNSHIYDNVISGSTGTYGGQMSGEYNIFENNTIKDGSKYGYYINGTNNIVRKNAFVNNPTAALYFYKAGNNNSIYQNTFRGNGALVVKGNSGATIPSWVSPSAVDYSYNGALKSGIVGNYWNSSYTGTDADGNGIGDSAFTPLASIGTDTAPLMGVWQDGTIVSSPDVIAPVAGFIQDSSGGQAPFTVQFNGYSRGPGTVTSYAWDFGDGTTSTDQNPSHTYTTSGTYSVNLTVTGPGGSTSTVKTGLITVTSPGADLVVSAGPTSTSSPAPNLFAHYTANSLSATVKNTGTQDAGSFKVSFNVDGNVTAVTVTSLAAGASTVVSTTDTVDRSVGASVPVTVTADAESAVAESNEANNGYSYSSTVIRNGYAGMRWGDGPDITTNKSTALHGDIIYSLGTSSYGSGTSTWTASNLPIPAGATVKDARLYITYCWDSGNVMPGAAVTSFNGVSKSYDAFYSDKKNWGGYAYPFGVIIYNVTDQFNKDGNSVSASGIPPIRGMELVVTYEDPTATEKQIFVNEGFDLLFASSSYYTTEETATAYAPFTGSAIDLGSVNKATLTTFINKGGSGDTRGTMLFNGQEYPNYWVQAGPEIGVNTTDVTAYLASTGNTAGYRSLIANNMDMEPHLAILKVEYGSPSSTPVAAFSANTTSGTAPLTVQFTDASTGTPASWAWDFDNDGAVDSILQNPEHTYTIAGTYSVNLTATNAGGSDHELKTGYITINAGSGGVGSTGPVAAFAADTTSGTTPFTVTFTDSSEGFPTAWLWDFGDSNTTNSTLQNPIHTYTSAGTYSVNLTATNTSGTTNILKSNYITVTSSGSEAPVAGFVADVTSGSFPLAIQFTDKSTGSVTGWNWDFGDYSTPSSQQNPVHTYTNYGKYNVTLTTTGPGGSNTTIKNGYITVNLVTGASLPLTTVKSGTVSGDLYVGSFQPVPFASQPGANAVTSRDIYQSFTIPTFTNIEWARVYVNVYSGTGSGDWPSRTTTSLDGNGDGVYETVLGVENMTTGSSYSKDGKVYWVNDHMNRIYSDYEIEYNVTDRITSPHPAVHIRNVKIGTGSYDGRLKAVTLVVAYNDGDSDQVKYWVNHGGDWIDSGSSSTTFGTTGIATGFSNATLSNVALSSIDGTYTFNGIPQAGANPVDPVNYYENHTWSVTSAVNPASNSIFQYTLGSSSFKTTLATLAVKYPGSTAPVAGFSAGTTSGTVPLTVTFTDSSTNSPTSWLWDFGDSNSTNATVQNPVHTYVSAGTYTVNLTATNMAGSDSEVKTGHITVTGSAGGSMPVANFTATPVIGLAPLSITFTDISSNTPTSWNWESRPSGTSDGWTSFSTAQSPVNLFSSGAWDIRLTATNTEGSNAITQTQYISASAGPARLTTVQNGTVSGDLYVGAYQPTAWSSQSTTPGLRTFTQAFTIPTHTSVQWARLYAGVYAAGTDNRTGQAVISFDSNGDGTYETALGTERLATGSTSAADVYPVNDHVTRQYSDYLLWYDVTPYINANTVNAQIVTQNLNGSTFDGRLKELTLVVAYNDGDSDTVQYWVNDGHDYQASSASAVTSTFATTPLVTGWTNATLRNVGLSAQDAIYTLNGNSLTRLGSGLPSFETNAWDVKTFLNAGADTSFIYQHNTSSSYKTTLATLAVKYTTAAPAPVANFTTTPTTGTAPLTVFFTDTSTNTPTSWSWDFGDSNTTNATVQNPVHTYTIAGTYTVNLTVMNAAGSDSELKTGYIIVGSSVSAAPVAAFLTTVTAGPAPLSVQFTDKSATAPTSWSWDFNNDSVVDSTEQSPTFSYATAGIYTVKLTVTNASGSNTITKPNAIAVSAGPKRLTTIQNGTVSGDLYVGAYQPTAFGSQTSKSTNQVDQSFTLPAYTTIQWAQLYTVVFGSSTDNRAGTATITFDGNGDGTYETALGTEQLAIPSTSAADVFLVSDHVNKQNTDYLIGYDVTSLISAQNPKARVVATPVDATFDARIKTVTLVVAYNDGDSDQVHYWVNDGHDFQTSSGSVVTTTFATSALASGWTNATLMNVGLSSQDAIYTINGNALARQSNNALYFETNTWDVKNNLTAGADSRFTYLHNSTSTFKTILATLAVKSTAGTIPSAPAAAFSGTPTSGTAPLAVTFTDTSTNSPTAWTWDFGDSNTTNATVQNPVHTYTTAGTYTVKLTATNSLGSNSTTRTGYITASGTTTGSIDLQVSNLTTNNDLMFAHEPNSVSATISNAGTSDAGAFQVQFLVDSTQTPVTVTGLAAGANTTLEITDPVLRSAGSTVTITVTADNTGAIAESDETNNTTTTTKIIVNNGYKGMRYTDGNDLTTRQVFTLNGDTIYSLGDSAYGSTSGSGYTATWTADNLPIPAGATVRNARLYATYTWDYKGVMPGNATLAFNGQTIPYETHYSDRKNWGSWAQYAYGELVYNVTSAFSVSGNNVILKSTPGVPFRGMELVVTYEDPSASEKVIFINDGFDLLFASPTYSTTPEEATAYAPFTGATIDTTQVENATLITFVDRGSAGATRGTMLFNGNSWPDYWVQATPAEIGVSESDVKSWLTASDNTALFRSEVKDNMDIEPHLAILKVEYHSTGPSLPKSAFTANVTTGTAPLVVKFTDKSTGIPTSWVWDFGDGQTSANQNPIHTYASAGTYSVNLTSTNAVGSNHSAKSGYITVTSTATAPVTAFSANKTAGDVPLSVKFTDASTGTPTGWTWDFGDGDSASTQNPIHTYTMAGTYTVKLTADNAAGSNSITKAGYISANAVTIIKNNFTIPSIQTTSGGGMQNLSINTTLTTVTTTGNNVNVTNVGNGWNHMDILMTDTPANDGTTINGTVDSVKAVTEPVTAPIASIGTPVVQIELNLEEMPGSSAGITQIITKDPDATAQSAFVLAATNAGKQIDEIAYTLNIVKTDLANAGDGGIIINATIQMSVSPAWVSAHGGTDSIVIMRRADDGSTQFLTTRFVGMDASGYYVFSAYSPSGLSTFVIAGISSTPSTTPTSSSISSGSSSGESDSSSSSGNSNPKSEKQKGQVYDYALLAPMESNPASGYQTTLISKKGRVSVSPLKVRIETMPEAKSSWNAEIVNDPDGGGKIATSIISTISGTALASYRTALAGQGLDITAVAYAMSVTKDDRVGATRNGVIDMTAPQEWVTANGGVDRVKIFRVGDDGTAELLSTSFSGYDQDSRYLTFRAVSPNGLCSFTLIAVKPAANSNTASLATSGQQKDTALPSTGDSDIRSTVTPSGTGIGPQVIIAAVLIIAGCIGLAVIYKLRRKDE